MPKRIDFTSSNGKTNIEAMHWPCTRPQAVLQLCHGMCEHIERYDDFANFLNSNNIAVVGNNHLGHGNSLIDGQRGFLGANGAYNNMVEDLELLRKRTALLYPDLPYFLFGHSMGSFITRLYIARYGEKLSGTIICGTSGPNPLSQIGITLSSIIVKLRGEKYVSLLLRNITDAPNLKRIPNARTSADWLSRDSEKVDAFIKDERCGFTFTASAYRELARMVQNVSDDAWYRAIPKQLPLMLISGSEDPVGKWGNGVTIVRDKLLEVGVQSLTFKLYPDARHELLNETNRTEVYADVLAFLDSII